MRSRRPPASRRSCVGLPAMSAQPVRRLDLTAGDADLEPAAGEMAAAVAMVVGLVGREPSVAGMTTLADRLLPTPGVTNAGSGKLRTCLLQISPTAWFCSCQWQAADADGYADSVRDLLIQRYTSEPPTLHHRTGPRGDHRAGRPAGSSRVR